MGVFTITQESTSPVAAHRLFKAVVLERHVVIPKAQPQTFKSSEIIEGDGGVGTVKKTNFAEGMPFKAREIASSPKPSGASADDHANLDHLKHVLGILAGVVGLAIGVIKLYFLWKKLRSNNNNGTTANAADVPGLNIQMSQTNELAVEGDEDNQVDLV